MSDTSRDLSTILEAERIFHDEWAKEIDPDELDVYAAFTGPTTPEYHFALQQLGDLKGKRLLEIGCGAGEAAVFFAQRGAQVTATDLSEGMLDRASSLALRCGVMDNIQLGHMCAEQLSLESQSFDLVFGNSVLHHINLDLALVEVRRVLKPSGRAVFIEPLIHNPVINVYRWMAKQVRTPDEHPLRMRDIDDMRACFDHVEHREFQLCTLLIFIWFLVGEGVWPSQARYWKKMVLEGERYSRAFNFLNKLDCYLLSRFPALSRFCWVTVITVS